MDNTKAEEPDSLSTEDFLESALQDKETSTFLLLKKEIGWWESKRWIYNLLVGISGMFSLGTFYSFAAFSIFDFIGIVIWGIIANIFYSLGILFEIWNFHYASSRIQFSAFRRAFFILGVIFSCAVTFYFGLIYCLDPIHFP